MATGVISWSQTASSNATADSTVNWAEGMSPAAVNDSARAEMASVAKWRDDLNGSITTGGTSTAYTVTSNQGMALTAGYVVAFVPNATNGATVTLNVDSLGAKPLRSAPGVELPAGALVEGTPYVATYYTSNSGEWILHGFYGDPYGLPIGGMLPYLGSTAPNSSFVLPYGQAISRTTYATLFTLVSTTFGVGDGTTTFNLPDIRGRSIAGLDNMGGSAASRLTSTYFGTDATVIGAVGGSESNTLDDTMVPDTAVTVDINDPGHTHTVSGGFVTSAVGSGGASGASLNISVNTASGTTGITASGTVSGGGLAHANVQPTIVLPFIVRVI